MHTRCGAQLCGTRQQWCNGAHCLNRGVLLDVVTARCSEGREKMHDNPKIGSGAVILISARPFERLLVNISDCGNYLRSSEFIDFA